MFLTLTLLHGCRDGAQEVLDALRDAYRYLTTGREWTKRKERLGYRGMTKRVDWTMEANGYHPHLHLLWFLEAELEDAKLRELRSGSRTGGGGG